MDQWESLANGLLNGDLTDEEEVLESIRLADARLKLTQESYRARDMVINDTILKAILKALRREKE